MVSIEFVTEFVYEHCENVKTSKGGTHFLARCPICGDSNKSKSKRRFNLDFNSGQPIFNCFNCGSSGSFVTLYATLKCISIPEALKALREYNSENLIKRLTKHKKISPIKEAEYDYHDYILNDCISATEKVDGYLKAMYQKQLRRFIADRGVSATVFVAYKGDYQSRFIIPIYDESNHIVYFQARAMNDSVEPKYKNPTMSKGNVIYNKHKFNRNKSIIICEGLLDAMSIGNQGTSCLGKEINEVFVSEIRSLTDKDIIIALDNDRPGYESMVNIINSNNITKNVRFFLFPYKYIVYKDLNEFFVKENINNLYDFVIHNSYSSVSTYTKIKTEVYRKYTVHDTEEDRKK
jgi:hypothetical protein